MRILSVIFLFVSLSLAHCMKVITNPLDASGPAGLLFSQLVTNAVTPAPTPSYYLFTNTNKILVTKGDGIYTAQTFSGVTAGRLDAVAMIGTRMAGVNSADGIGYVSSDRGGTWNTSSGIVMGAGTKTLKNCGGVLSATGVNGLNLATASSPDGITFTSVNTGFAGPSVYGAGCHGSKFLVAFTTTSGPLTGTIGNATDGRNYTNVAVGGTIVPLGLTSDGTTIMALDSTSNYYTSTDGGASFSAPTLIASRTSPWRSLGYIGGRFMAVFHDGVSSCIIAAFSAGNWTGIAGGSRACATAPTWNATAVSGTSAMIAGTLGGSALVYRSTDNGATWVTDPITEPGVTSINDIIVVPAP